MAMIEIDLEKYGLAHNDRNDISSWSDPDVDRLIDAFNQEGIAPTVMILPPQLPTIRNTIDKLLSRSYCRRCGKCCLPNPIHPELDGVLFFRDEIEKVARYRGLTYKYLKKKALKHKSAPQKDIKYLPLPCVFYNKGKCLVYDVRPHVCQDYPISDELQSNGEVAISINVRCDYGIDLYKSIINDLRAKKA